MSQLSMIHNVEVYGQHMACGSSQPRVEGGAGPSCLALARLRNRESADVFRVTQNGDRTSAFPQTGFEP